MNILLIGKYPPIEGGVSSHNYWFTREFTARGHFVHVVTNASPLNRALFARGDWWREPADSWDDEDHSQYCPKGVKVSSFDGVRPHHIPYSPAYVSALVGKGLDALKEQNFDIIVAHYLEPYAVAGLLLKKLTGLPLVVKHAGSDVSKLFLDPLLRPTYEAVFTAADAVVTGRAAVPLVSQTVEERRMHFLRGPYIPEQFFCVDGPQLDFKKYSGATIPEGVPVITYFGKVSRNKGLVELVEALDGIDHEFRLLIVAGKREFFEILETKISQTSRVKDRCLVMDLIPPWRIPELLRASALTVSLEYNFPVAIHYPMKAFESILCGTPVLLSGELFRKTSNIFPEIGDMHQFVENPADIGVLRQKIKEMLLDQKHTKERVIATRNAYLKNMFWEKVNTGYEKLFRQLCA